ncbi:2',5' RNA ligase family [bacterium BMS3Abin15]|nr:2',5' RNA ligase family [bacterium BMS3Abin15]HDZ85499.1 RNA 2',3'-cyclic phosphodiesterase [Candidatus Moranbacteria bacterium]
MQRRIFIGIELPQQARKQLIQATEKWQNLPVKWGRIENMHATLLFLGYIDDEMIPEICDKIRKGCQKSDIFDINFEKIVLGPDAKRARMFWLEGNPSEKLKQLKNNIGEELGIFQRENKAICPHITLGRIKRIAWKKLPKVPAIDEELSLSIPVESVQIFESLIEEGKRKFIVLESCPLSY